MPELASVEESEGQPLVSSPDHRREFLVGGAVFVALVVIAFVLSLVAIEYFK